MCFKCHPALKKPRTINPTNHSTSLRSNLIRRKESFEACSAIYGGSSVKPEPIIEGILDTLTSKFKTKQISDSMFSGKQTLVNTIKKNISKQWSKRFYNSQQNKTLNTYYSHYVLGKRKYLNLRKANKQAKFDGNSVPNFLPYTELALEINKIDIGKLKNLSRHSSDYEKVPGPYRDPIAFILRVAKFYLHVNEKRTDKLKSFESFSCKIRGSFLFAIAIGGNSAPGTGMSVLVSFLNIGQKIANSAEQFLLFGTDVEENLEIVTTFIRKLVHDLEILENNIYDISVMWQIKKIEFKVTDLPNDMKMLS